MPTSIRLRRLFVGLVGLASLAAVLWPSGNLKPTVALLGGTLFGIAQADALDCTTTIADMAGMPMAMPADCLSPR